MLDVKERMMTEDEAFTLAEKMAAHDTANYLIREALIEKGFSAVHANEIITKMRRAHLNDHVEEPMDIGQIALILVLLTVVVLVVIALLSGSPT